MAETTTRTTYELARLQAFSERWHYLVLAVRLRWRSWRWPCWMCRRDSVELRRGVAWLLLALRVAALAGLLVFYLHLEKRTERKVVHNSRVLVLVDTSLSMGLARRHGLGRAGHAQPARASRLRVLDDGELVDKLREKHDVLAEPLRRRRRTASPRSPSSSQPRRSRPTSQPPAADEAPTSRRARRHGRLARRAAAARHRNPAWASRCGN